MSTFDLVKLSNMRMPFGKYSNWHLVDLPETVLIWFSFKGLPKCQIGDMMKPVLERKTNGLKYLLAPLKKR